MSIFRPRNENVCPLQNQDRIHLTGYRGFTTPSACGVLGGRVAARETCPYTMPALAIRTFRRLPLMWAVPWLVAILLCRRTEVYLSLSLTRTQSPVSRDAEHSDFASVYQSPKTLSDAWASSCKVVNVHQPPTRPTRPILPDLSHLLPQCRPSHTPSVAQQRLHC